MYPLVPTNASVVPPTPLSSPPLSPDERLLNPSVICAEPIPPSGIRPGRLCRPGAGAVWAAGGPILVHARHAPGTGLHLAGAAILLLSRSV